MAGLGKLPESLRTRSEGQLSAHPNQWSVEVVGNCAVAAKGRNARRPVNAGWDEELLAEELGALHALDLDFNVDLIGFTIAEMDVLVEGLTTSAPWGPISEAGKGAPH